MSVCQACNGEGIVGAGDFPLAKQGPLSTCGICGGTGKGVESEVTASTPVEEVKEEESFLGDSPQGSDGSSEEGV